MKSPCGTQEMIAACFDDPVGAGGTLRPGIHDPCSCSLRAHHPLLSDRAVLCDPSPFPSLPQAVYYDWFDSRQRPSRTCVLACGVVIGCATLYAFVVVVVVTLRPGDDGEGIAFLNWLDFLYFLSYIKVSVWVGTRDGASREAAARQHTRSRGVMQCHGWHARRVPTSRCPRAGAPSLSGDSGRLSGLLGSHPVARGALGTRDQKSPEPQSSASSYREYRAGFAHQRAVSNLPGRIFRLRVVISRGVRHLFCDPGPPARGGIGLEEHVLAANGPESGPVGYVAVVSYPLLSQSPLAAHGRPLVAGGTGAGSTSARHRNVALRPVPSLDQGYER